MMRCPRAPFASVLAGVLAMVAVGVATPAHGKPRFASPNANPLARSPVLAELYVVNTAGDTLDVVDTGAGAVTARIPVGIDPVSVAVRPDGKEVWVSNHVSDTVSVVDVDPASPTRYQVVATVTAWSEDGWVTDFDEPVGIAFASNAKAYVALSSRNRIAVVDVVTRTVTKQVHVLAQEPRAITVRGNRLYVIPFESGNTTELSGCFTLTDPGCTFNILDLASNSIDAILTRNMVADIVRRPGTPDRDLFVYDTADESTLFEVSGLGTLLYGLAVDSTGDVFVALTEARNDANGHMGTAGADLIDMGNRAFLNQIARVDCSAGCSDVTHIDLEPVPPADPAPGTQLATPFGIQVSGDDSTIVAVAAASSRLFTMDAATGTVLGRVDVGAIPRGLVLEDAGGAPSVAWVLNAIEDSVSRVDISDPANPHETARIPLDDPTLPDVKRGEIRFNDANGSTTGTFACASCHPDGHTDQLLWNLGARCLTPGCDQTQPRVTMPIRGLRDTLPLHWDGTVGDPFGGINAAVADSGVMVPPNCTDEDSCFRDLVNGSMATTMCDQAACPNDQNELGLPGAFGEADRDAIAVFLRAVPYPPARSRRLDDHFSPLAAEGFRNFLIGVDNAHPGCSRARACHALPFWNGTNTSDTGFDAPTFRGLTDRHAAPAERPRRNVAAALGLGFQFRRVEPARRTRRALLLGYDVRHRGRSADQPDELRHGTVLVLPALRGGLHRIPRRLRATGHARSPEHARRRRGRHPRTARSTPAGRCERSRRPACDRPEPPRRQRHRPRLRRWRVRLRERDRPEPQQRLAGRRRPSRRAGRHRHGSARGPRGRRAPAAGAVALPAQREQSCGPCAHPGADRRADAHALWPAHRRAPDRPRRRTGGCRRGDLRAGRRAARLPRRAAPHRAAVHATGGRPHAADRDARWPREQRGARHLRRLPGRPDVRGARLPPGLSKTRD